MTTSLTSLVGAALRRWWRVRREQRRRLRAMTRLEKLTDRELEDIGVLRSEIDGVTHLGYGSRKRKVGSFPLASPRGAAPLNTN